jgi:hypothetical protein
MEKVRNINKLEGVKKQYKYPGTAYRAIWISKRMRDLEERALCHHGLDNASELWRIAFCEALAVDMPEVKEYYEECKQAGVWK